ncbi:MAG TPA: 5-formyltetrahydrofolate cyclo-ligase [Candidatus Bathyarchaeia archaeon]|nr:5-formyltetrahydrofolate cyclo-ligase [Candidatus Bathyarchaeia archaeon]
MKSEEQTIAHKKDNMRRIMLQKRNSLAYDTINTKSVEIQQRFTNSYEFNHVKILASYFPTGSEVRTEKIISAALKSNRLVALPRTEGEDIKFYQIFLSTNLILGRFGIKEPPISSNSLVSDDIDLLLVPGILFDTRGYRIGYGYGYYDKFIAKKKKSTLSVGLAYECQMCEEIPRSNYDQKINILVTEKRMLYF